MSYPKVSVQVTNGNLQRSIEVSDGVGAIAATVATAGLIGKTVEVYSLADAEQKGITAAAEPFMHGLVESFYAELGGNQRLFLFGVAAEMPMADVVKTTEANGLLKLLTEAKGEITLVAIARQPDEDYAAGAAFLDKDVELTVLGSKALCEAQQAALTPIRLLIEGRVANEDAPIGSFKPNEAGNGFAAVVLGGTAADGSAAVSVALARACKYAAHVKLGSGQNGALSSVQQVYIGSKTMEERLDMETLHDAGFLTFQRRSGAAGYYFGRDNMCATDDFKILAHGRVIDKATRVAAQAYLPFLEEPVRLETDGTLNTGDTAYVENVLETALLNKLSGQMSGVKVVIDPNQDILATETLQVGCQVLPLGYSTWISVTLGLTSSIK